MEKYIYIITNDINNKVYIGQSNDPKYRFNQHCRPNNDNSLIDLAIQKAIRTKKIFNERSYISKF